VIRCLVCYDAFLLSTYIISSVHSEKMRTGSISGVLRANTNYRVSVCKPNTDAQSLNLHVTICVI